MQMKCTNFPELTSFNEVHCDFLSLVLPTFSQSNVSKLTEFDTWLFSFPLAMAHCRWWTK